ncbi:MAG: OsmC family protein [Oceanicoccus sp.]
MEKLPHLYRVNVSALPEDNLLVSADGLPALAVAPPRQFDGPGDQWSPEELLMAAVANCLVLSFRAIAKASSFEWLDIECQSEGVLDKVDRKMQFTTIKTYVKLTIAASDSAELANKLLHKAEEFCLVSNSLSSQTEIECEIIVAA